MTILPESSPSSPGTRRRRPVISRGLAAAVALALLGGGAGGAWYFTRGTSPAKPTTQAPPPLVTARPTTAAGWIAAARHAIIAADSVHVTNVNRLPHQTMTFSNDHGRTSGRQVITPGPGMRAEVRVIGTATYFTGNAMTLTKFFGFPAATAAKVSGRWLLLRPGDADYETVTEGVTLSSAASEVKVEGSITLLPARVINGVRAVGVRGVGPAPAGLSGTVTTTLWIDVTTMRPVRYEASHGNSTATATFSRWNAALTVRAPRAALVPAGSVNT